MKDEVSKREGKRIMQNNNEVNKNESSNNDVRWRSFEVQGYLEVKRQRNKSSGGNTQLVKVNNGYYQEWALRDLR